MLELLLAAVVVTGLITISFLPHLWTLEWLIHASVALILLGLGAGLPITGYYHIKLFTLLKKDSHPKTRWWLDPRPLHRHLPQEQSNRLLRWFFLGATCFVSFLVGAFILLVILLAP